MNPVARFFVSLHRRLLPDEPFIGWMPYMWLIFLSSFVAKVIWRSSGPVETIASWIALAVFLVFYFVGYWIPGPRIAISIVGITVIGLIFVPFNYGAAAFFIFAAAFAGMVGPPKHGALVIALVVLAVSVELAFIDVPLSLAISAVLFPILIGTVNVYYVENARKNAALRLSEDEIRRLGATAERERIARDLHDLLGHTLSVITLKSELASRLIASDPDRAAIEIREVETISRDALREVRAAVTGYRTGMSNELASARRALEAADIDFTYQLESVELPKPVEQAFSMVLREGVTNVVRHSGARRCSLQVSRDGTRWSMTLTDDGKGGAPIENSGLAGLRERLRAIGGSLHINAEDGFTLLAEAGE